MTRTRPHLALLLLALIVALMAPPAASQTAAGPASAQPASINAQSDRRVHYVGEEEAWLLAQDSYDPGELHETLTDALEAARDGDRVILMVDVEGAFTIDKRIELRGYGHRARPILSDGVTVTADGVRLDMLHFRTQTSTALTLQTVRDVAVTRSFFTECKDGITLIQSEDCLLEENRMIHAGVVRLFGGRGHRLRRNLIDSSSFYALRLDGSTDALLEENHIRRAGWVGLLLHSNAQAEIIGNVFEDTDIGLSLQTNGNVVRDNLFFGVRRGLALTRSPFGKDNKITDRIVYFDSDTGDTDVVIRDNLIEHNTFRDCRRDAVVLKQAVGNTLRENVLRGHGERGLVLMEGADDNLLEGNRVGEDIELPLLVVRSRGNRFADNQLPDGAQARLVGAPGNEIEGVDVDVLADGEIRRDLAPAPGQDKYLLAFGDFHTHSLLSDGSSTPDELLAYARDVAGLDFVAMSDHGEYVGHGDGRWAALEEAIERFAVPGFVTFPGYETTFTIGWSAHYNVYFAGTGGVPYMAAHGGKAWIPNLTTPTPTRLLQKLAEGEQDALVIRHHYWGTPDFWEESPADSDLMPMTEICSVHAIWTGDRDVDVYKSSRDGEVRGHASTLRGALRQGRVLGVGGSSDSHYCFPGDAGLTGVLTESLDRASLFAAIRARRTYATTGAPIRLNFEVDGEPMGSVLDSDGVSTGALWVEGTDELREVIIFENETELLRLDPEGRTAHIPFTGSGPVADGTYYMARVRQEDGELAWTSPIWQRPPQTQVVSDEVLLDRERMVILAYAAVMRAWPDLPTKDLGWKSPKEARTDPEWSARFDELWVQYLATVEELERLGEEAGITSRDQATGIMRKYAWRFGHLPPPIRLRPLARPLVNVETVKSKLGM